MNLARDEKNEYHGPTSCSSGHDPRYTATTVTRPTTAGLIVRGPIAEVLPAAAGVDLAAQNHTPTVNAARWTPNRGEPASRAHPMTTPNTRLRRRSWPKTEIRAITKSEPKN